MARSLRMTKPVLQDLLGRVRLESTEHYIKGVGACVEDVWEAARPRYTPELPAGLTEGVE